MSPVTSEKTDGRRSAAAVRRRLREKEILDATRALFDARGVRDAQIEDIARSVGINRAIIYRHFSGKEELFALTLVGYLDELEGRLAAADDTSASPTDTAARHHRGVHRLRHRVPRLRGLRPDADAAPGTGAARRGQRGGGVPARPRDRELPRARGRGAAGRRGRGDLPHPRRAPARERALRDGARRHAAGPGRDARQGGRAGSPTVAPSFPEPLREHMVATSIAMAVGPPA